MAEFVSLTTRGGKAVYVNLGLVECIAPKGRGAELTFIRLPWVSSDILTVRESPEDIVGRSITPCI